MTVEMQVLRGPPGSVDQPSRLRAGGLRCGGDTLRALRPAAEASAFPSCLSLDLMPSKKGPTVTGCSSLLLMLSKKEPRCSFRPGEVVAELALPPASSAG